MKEFLLSYDTVTLCPNYSSLTSRSDADTSLIFCGYNFKLPVVPANMNDVISISLAKYLSENGYFYIYHRFFKGHENTVRLVSEANHDNWKLISISIGVSNNEYDTLTALLSYRYRVDFITIDVAHADHDNVKSMVEFIHEHFPKTKLIVGNVATAGGASRLFKLGVDAIKVGIGGGSICTTRYKTGFHIPTLQSVHDAYQTILDLNYNIPIIADGGAKYYGDIAKALTFGATMIMNGRWFASCKDSPAESVSGSKLYRGSTSNELRGDNRHIEGQQVMLEDSGVTYEERLKEITQSLQSSISYAGGTDLSSFDSVGYGRILPFH